MMKNKIVQYANKYLSLLLAIVLLASSLIIPMAINAETDAAAKAAAVAALKAAWIDLESEHKGTAFAYPNHNMADWSWAGNTHLQTTAIADKDYYGDYYSYVDSTDNAFKDKVARVWYGKAEQGKEITGIDISTGIRFGQLREKSGFYIYVKVEGTTEGASIKINPEYNWKLTTANDKTVTITQDGIYMIKDTDLYKNGLEDIAAAVEAAAGDWNSYDRRMQRFILKFTDLNGAKVTCGSLHWVSNVSSTVPANINEMSANELISAAENVDTALPHYISSKVDAFITALNTVKNLYMDDAELFALINAYKKLENERKGTAFMYPNQALSYNSDTSPWIQNKDNGALRDQFLKESSTSDVDLFGTNFTALDTSDPRVKPGSADGKITLFFGDNSLGQFKNIFRNQPAGATGCGGATGFYVYVRVTDLQNPLTIKFAHNWGDTTDTETPYTITEDGLYRLTDKDFYENGVADFLEKIPAAGNFSWLRFELSNDSDAKIEVGAIHWANSDTTTTVPEEIESISALDLITKASLVENNDRYISQNWADFQTALENAKAAYADELTASDLKKAFIDMLPDKNTAYTDDTINAMTNDELLVAATSLHTNYGVYNAEKLAAFKTALEAFKAANFTPEEAAKINLKAAYEVLYNKAEQYSFVSTNGTYWGSRQDGATVVPTEENTDDRKYLGRRYLTLDPNEKFEAGRFAWLQRDSNSQPSLNTYDGFYFYIHVKQELTSAFEFVAFTKYTDDVTTGENCCVLPAGTAPGYYLFTDRDFYSKGYNSVKDTHNADILAICLKTDYTGGNIDIGAVFGYNYVEDVPTDSDTWSLEKFANYTVNYIADNNYIISDGFRKLFADAQKLGAGVYNGDFDVDGAGFKFVAPKEEGTSGKYYQSYFDADNKKIVVENLGWKTGGILENKVVIEPNTDYVLTYRFKGSNQDSWIRSGVNLVGNNESLDSSKISMTVSSNAELGDYDGWAPTKWINGIKHTVTNKLVNVAVRFNSGDNDYLNMSMAYQGECNYTYDYFKLTKAVDVEKGNVNGDSEVDILDLVRLKKFLNDGDTQIAFEAAKVHNTGETVNNDDFNALRSKLLEPTV